MGDHQTLIKPEGSSDKSQQLGSAEDCLAGGGHMGALMRSMDWSKTPIGPVESWSLTLRMMVRLMLWNRLQIFLWWGPQFVQMYNDASWRAIGTKHPRSMGQLASECWPEIWHIIGPLIETPFRGGQATWMEDIFLEMNRKGFIEETHWTIAYSPVLDETAPSGIGGVIGTVNEITEKVVGERRVLLLRDLGARSSEAKTAEEACVIAAAIMNQHREDVPFALLYLVSQDRKKAQLASAAGVALGQPESPMEVNLHMETAADPVWPLAEAMLQEQVQFVKKLQSKLANVPPGPWADPPRSALVCPIRSNIPHQLAGLLVLGVSSRLSFDDRYRGFCDLVSGQIATAIANARAYEEERKRAEALAEIDRAKTQFFSNVSHEFRTPLTLMLGPIEEMLSRGNGAVTIRRDELELVHRNSLRLLKLVNALLDFSRIEAGRAQAAYEPVDLPTFTAELASVFRAAMEKAGLQLNIDCPRLDEPVYVDRSMWEKIVLNLLSNAFKFTFDGEITLALKKIDEHVELSVTDTGTGIAENELPKVFERFHRIEGARGRTFEGSGIGLALVQELAKLHGGTVKVRSTYGKGTQFTVSIPTGRVPLPARQVEPSRVSHTVGVNAYVQEALRWLPDTAVVRPSGAAKAREIGERRRILFADDNADLRQYVQRLLSAEYDVKIVPDGEAALAAARQMAPDLVLTDVMMPRLDGFGLLKALRDDPATRNLPVILLSARAGEESRVEGLAAGATDYLVKPFSARELLTRIGSCLEIAAGNREALQHERTLRRSAERAEMHTKSELLGELTGMRRLHELSNHLLQKAKLQPLLDAILETAVTLQSADFGLIQIYDPESKDLYISAQHGFSAEFQECLKLVKDRTTACGRALLGHNRVVIEDVEADEEFAPHRKMAAGAGFRAVQSTPLFSRGEEPLGVLSTQFRCPHYFSERELRLTDLCAHFAALVIEQKQAEESLQLSQAQLIQAQRLSHTGSWTLNVASGSLHWSEEHYRIVGLEPGADIRGYAESLEVIHPDDRAMVRRALQESTSSRSKFEVDCRIVRPDGTIRYIHSIADLVLDDAGRATDYVGTIIDVTERRRAEEKLQKLQTELAHVSRVTSMGELTASIAHEINQPLSAIVANASACTRMLASRPPDLEEIRSAVEDIADSGRRASEVVSRIRGLLRKSHSEKCRLEINEVIAEVLPLIRGELDRYQTKLYPDLQVGLPQVMGDRIELQQVLINLLLNGMEAMTSVWDRPRTLLLCSHIAETGGIVVAVRDSGVGLPSDKPEAIFNAFFTTKLGGMGMGLAISRTIIESHGGKLWATPNQNGGATFQFALAAAA